MFNSSAKLSLLLTLKECRSCVVFLMQDHSNRRVYACVTSPNLNRSRQTTTAACRVDQRAEKLHSVMESVKMDSKHSRCSTTPAPADGAGGMPVS